MVNLFYELDPNNKVLVLPHICNVEIDTEGIATPSKNPSLQSFYNTLIENGQPEKVYSTPSRIKLSETTNTTRAGLVYTQILQLQFPSNDPLRVTRFKNYLNVKYIYITLSTGMVFMFGRNDYFQNTPPKIKMSSDENTTQISYTIKSMFSLGFTNGSFDFQFSEDLPVNFFNL